MDVAEYRALQARAMLEADLQSQTIALATRTGWRHYHTHNSRRSPGGFPDLVLVRGARLVFAELKKQDGTYRPGQREWLADLNAAGAETYTWRPSDLLDRTIEKILTTTPERTP